MNLYEKWEQLSTDESNPQQLQAFWKTYYAQEQAAYEKILAEKTFSLKGTAQQLMDAYAIEPEVFAGFIDGMKTSLKGEVDTQSLTEQTELELQIDPEKLYFNMLDAKADWLYNLPQWDEVLTREQRRDIHKQWQATKTVVVDKPVGRNDPCPCGSGKKYKKCCGKNL
ncbi:MAG: SEC-C metal-binding domain-containing protein [Christensenellales bacterium]|jgi:hypothetical protein